MWNKRKENCEASFRKKMDNKDDDAQASELKENDEQFF
jgi:hypothetical protein